MSTTNRSAAGSIRRLDDGPANRPGRYELRFRGKSKTVRGTKGNAEHALALFIAQHSGELPEVSVTLSKMIEARIDHIAAKSSPVTINEYRRIAAKGVEPYPIGDVKIDRLNVAQIEKHYAMLLASKKATPMTITALHRLIRSALNQAWRWSWIESNPAAKVQLTPAKKKQRKLPPVQRVLDALAALDEWDPPLASLIRVAAGTGMRRGELCGLRWCDVNLHNGKLRVHRSVAYSKSELILKGTKTGEERSVPIGPDTAAILSTRWQEACDWADQCGVVLDPEVAHVWSDDPTGAEPWRPGRPTLAWRKIADEYEMPDVRLHDLRKLYVSLLRAAGVPLATVAESVGHADKRTTEAIYEQSLAIENPSGSLIDALLAGTG